MDGDDNIVPTHWLILSFFMHILIHSSIVTIERAPVEVEYSVDNIIKLIARIDIVL